MARQHTTQQLLNLVRNYTRDALRDPEGLEVGDAVVALHAFRRLDLALSSGGTLPNDWRARRNPVRRRPLR